MINFHFAFKKFKFIISREWLGRIESSKMSARISDRTKFDIFNLKSEWDFKWSEREREISPKNMFFQLVKDLSRTEEDYDEGSKKIIIPCLLSKARWKNDNTYRYRCWAVAQSVQYDDEGHVARWLDHYKQQIRRMLRPKECQSLFWCWINKKFAIFLGRAKSRLIKNAQNWFLWMSII